MNQNKEKKEEKLSENIYFHEWKECRVSIGRFDEILLNIRKYGFSLLTVLLSADGFLYAKTSPSKGQTIGIYLTFMVLIVSLLRVDRHYAVFLNATAERAYQLEKKLKLQLTTNINRRSALLKTVVWGIWLYISFCLVNMILVLGSFINLNSMDDFLLSIQKNIGFIVAVFIIGLLVSMGMYLFHLRKKWETMDTSNLTMFQKIVKIQL